MAEGHATGHDIFGRGFSEQPRRREIEADIDGGGWFEFVVVVPVAGGRESAITARRACRSNGVLSAVDLDRFIVDERVEKLFEN